MKRYLFLYLIFFKNSLIRMMENRFDFIFRAIPTILNLSINLFVISFIFSKIKEISGWNKEELFLLLGTYNIVWGLFFGLFIQNMAKINGYISRGDLDLFLTKPIDSQFYISVVNPIDFGEGATVILGIFLVTRAVNIMNINLNLIQFFTYAVIILSAVVAAYSLWFISLTLSFWIGRVYGLHEAFISFFEINKYPSDIFNGIIRNLFVYFLPLGVMVTFPTKFLLNRLDPMLIIWGSISGIIFLVTSHIFWNFALKRYSSASS